MSRAGSLHQFLMDLHSRFGSISGFWWGQTYVVSIASPELMTQHNNVFDRPPLLFKTFEVLIGPKCIDYANGSDGRERRRTYDPAFAHDKIDRYMCYFEECAQTLENKWLSYGKEDHIPLSEDCLVYAIHCAILSILGDFLKEEKTFNQFKENYMLVWNHMEYSLASPFAAQDDESKKRFDKVITWAMYFLATHKDVQDKLYKEVKSVIGEKGAVDKDNFSEFVYLIQVIDETMRCSVLASMAARFQDFDTPVIHALGVQLQDEKLWPLPNKFDPDRFSPENKKELPNTSFVPFGFAGKRKCPGYRFAYWDAGVFLATVIRKFEVKMCEDQVVTPVYGLVTHPQDEIWVKVTKRQ